MQRRLACLWRRLLLLMCAGCLCLHGAYAEQDVLVSVPRARIESPSLVFNFGKITAGVQLEHQFLLRNTGNVDLVIERVVSGCGCTQVGIPTPIFPGEEGKLSVVFDSSGLSGPISKVVRVFSNDESRPFLDLRIEGEVMPDVQVSPAVVDFGTIVKGGSPPPVEVQVEVNAELNLELGEAKAFSPYLILTESRGDARRKHLRVGLAPSVPLGELRERVMVPLLGENARRTVVNLPVFALVEESLRLEPKIVSFGLVRGEVPMRRQAKLVSLTPEPVHIEKFRIRPAGIEVSIEPENAQQTAHLIHLTLDPKVVRENMAAALEIITNRVGVEKLVLPVHAVFPYKP